MLWDKTRLLLVSMQQETQISNYNVVNLKFMLLTNCYLNKFNKKIKK